MSAKKKATKKNTKGKKGKKSKKKKSKSSEAAVKLEVCLHETADPPVFISERSKPAGAGNDIEWKRTSGAKKFDFVAFEPDAGTSVFNPIDVKSNKVTCTFNPGSEPGGHPYPYTITVKRGGKKYTSTRIGPDPTDGRPVIRKSIGP
jgi:hypothetical protein